MSLGVRNGLGCLRKHHRGFGELAVSSQPVVFCFPIISRIRHDSDHELWMGNLLHIQCAGKRSWEV